MGIRMPDYLPKEKLPVQVADVDCVHVDDVNVFEAHQRQIGKDLASETSSSNYEDL